MKWNSTLITIVNFRRISFDAKNQIGVLDYNIGVVPLPKWKQIKTFYPDDPERRHSQSFAGFEIHLARKSNKHIQNYFIPSGIMVIMSWVSVIFGFSYPNQETSSKKAFKYNFRLALWYHQRPSQEEWDF